MSNCIFCKIIAREIPAQIVYQDEFVTAFRDINPEAPVHILVVPNSHIVTLDQAGQVDEGIVGKVFLAAGKIAFQEGVTAGGYRVVANFGVDAGQIVPHLHLHLLAGRKFGWPPG
jgi:histidine triad (HIT) family protein